MRRSAALVTLLVCELFVVALALFVHLRSRPAILAAFRDYGTTLPPLTRVALAPWFLPAAIACALAASSIAIVAPLKRSRRLILAGTALTALCLALIFAIVAAFYPIFRPD